MKKSFLWLPLTAIALILTFTGELFSQPSVSEASRDCLTFPLIFAKRYNYQGLHIYDTFYQWRNRGGGGIFILENPADPPEKHRVRPIIDATTNPTLGDGIYSDPSLSFDAKTILFCYKATPNGNSVIYEIGVDGKNLRQLTNLDNQGNPYKGRGGGHHDVRPAYLPDGRIVFTSTRYSGLVPCANNGVAILHVMNNDGSDIHPISVNSETEFYPEVLPDGRILFGRWEYIDKNALTIQSLWSVYPDGTNETAFFGNNMVFPEAILQAKPVPGNDHLVVAAFTPHNAPPRGSIAMIDISAGIQNSATGKNDEKSIFNFEHPDNPTCNHGNSCDPWALNENVVIYSGMLKNPINNGTLNSILMIDRSGKVIEIHSDAQVDLHNPIPLRARKRPPVLVDSSDRSQTTGSFFVTDVYQGLPSVKRGTVKWLRVIEETSRVSESPGSNGLNQTFSISAALAWSPKIYHGLVPVASDGSVFFEVPSGRAVYFQLLDENYRLVRSMRTFIQAVPGTVRSCTGCHEYGPPQGSQSGKNSKRPQKLMPEPWGTGYMDYPSMIQPILNEKCVSCHGGEKGIAAGLDLSGAPTELFNISYVNLTSRREKQYIADLISGICCMNGTAYYSCKIFEPYSHGTGNAPAAELLMSDPIHKNLLTPEQRQLFFTWIDSNALYFGTWDYTKSGPYLRPWTDARSQIQQIMKENNCAECHADSKGNIARFENDWINLEQPEMSRVLRAPLKASETAPFGIGACRKHAFDQRYRRLGIMSAGRYEHAVKPLEAFPTQKWVPVAKAGDQSGDPVISWESSDNPVYQKMLTVIQKAKRQAYINPRIDMVEAAGKTDTIVAGRIRQIIPQPLPEKLPKASICLTKNNRVNLTWERNADTIGLVTEIHRSTTPHFTPSPETLIKETELFTYTDVLLPQGAYYYALVLVCDPAKTCGTCRVNPDIISEDGTGTAVQKSIEGRCPLSMFKPQKTEPIYLPVINTPVKTSAPTGTVFQRQDIDLSSDYVVLPGQDGYNAGEALTVSFDVWFDSTESMPIPVSFGKWRDSGWFLQSIGGKWRFHLSGTDCDSPQVIPLKQWIHLEACYQDCKMSLYQDGKLIASCSAPKPSELIPWTGDLFIGQYCAAEGKPFLFKGQIKNLKIVTQ